MIAFGQLLRLVELVQDADQTIGGGEVTPNEIGDCVTSVGADDEVVVGADLDGPDFTDYCQSSSCIVYSSAASSRSSRCSTTRSV
jgi:hypothetical protein